MKNRFSDIEYLFPTEAAMDPNLQDPPEEPFSVRAVAFLHALSLQLNRDPRTRDFPDLATFAFYCRKANILQLKKQYYPDDTIRKGRGLVFHITPANVPTTFAYSLLSGILSGNTNIVKVSSQRTEQSAIICDALGELTREEEHRAFARRMALVRFGAESPATAYYSSICDVRVIWGSDATVEKIRKNKLKPTATEITFASRYALCVINADAYLREKSPEAIAAGFYNDTYLYDQNACTAPHLVVWLGDDITIETARTNFWEKLHQQVKTRYTLQPHSAVDKLAAYYYQAAHSEAIKKVPMPDNLIWRTQLTHLPKNIENYRCNGGYFSEYKAKSLSDITRILTPNYQTLVCYGINKEELQNFIDNEKPATLDSIVAIGRTLDFSLMRDGVDLIGEMTRPGAG